MKPSLLEILCCPKCRGELLLVVAETTKLQCRECNLLYPVTDDIPQLDITVAEKPVDSQINQ